MSNLKIECAVMITDGIPTVELMDEYKSKGFKVIEIDEARKYSIESNENDIIVFFAKPFEKIEYDLYIENKEKLDLIAEAEPLVINQDDIQTSLIKVIRRNRK